jgi:uracil-DNA glycosylase
VKSFDDWCGFAKPLLAARVPWPEIDWASPSAADLESPAQLKLSPVQLTLPRIVMHLLQSIACYRDAGRWVLMYRIAWRTLYENRRLLEDQADPDVQRAELMDRAVSRECHKMHAFVRFREIRDEHGGASYFAWFEPQHEILRRAVSHFVRRFPNMDWTIATPDGAAVWHERVLRFAEPPDAASRPRGDSEENLWRTYYRSVCNVSRTNPVVMRREMPERYWRHLPEAAEIPILIRDGRERFAHRHREADIARLSCAKGVQASLAAVQEPSGGPAQCQRCGLWRRATQAVHGEGPPTAEIMLVGEQPGDEEDLRGRPFVGPAGQVLDEALVAAALTRAKVYVTNAVKHFKWEPRGKRRLHRRPDAVEVSACTVWLEQEIAAVKPSVIVALGVTALRALTGHVGSIEDTYDQSFTHASGALILATYHPAAILRAPADTRARLRERLIRDLTRARVTFGA